ncbi:MAG: ComF family protein [Candidatus Limnocylindria bacterium]
MAAPPIKLETLDPQPKRLGKCGQCPYFEAGSAPICLTCSLRSIDPLPDPADRCPRCEQRLTEGECKNWVCDWSSRGYEWNAAIGMRSGELKRVGDAFKLQGVQPWGIILGRLLAGFLDAQRERFAPFDLIIPSPGWTGQGAALPWDHAAEVVRWAADTSTTSWPFELEPVIIRTKSVPPLKELRSWKARKERAETVLRESLKVVAPEKVRRKDVLVYDDIFTDGFMLREVARALRSAGATRVCGVTLMRQPYVPKAAGHAP